MIEAEGRPSSPNKKAFAKRLQVAIERSGLTYEEIAQRAREQLPSDARLSSTSVWQYAHGKTFPRQQRYIDAISRALGVEASDLLAMSDEADEIEEAASAETGQSPVRVEDLGNGQAKLTIAIDVPWPVALKILALLTGDGDSRAG